MLWVSPHFARIAAIRIFFARIMGVIIFAPVIICDIYPKTLCGNIWSMANFDNFLRFLNKGL